MTFNDATLALNVSGDGVEEDTGAAFEVVAAADGAVSVSVGSGGSPRVSRLECFAVESVAGTEEIDEGAEPDAGGAAATGAGPSLSTSTPSGAGDADALSLRETFCEGLKMAERRRFDLTLGVSEGQDPREPQQCSRERWLAAST